MSEETILKIAQANVVKKVLETAKSSLYPQLNRTEWENLVFNVETASRYIFEEAPTTLTANVLPAAVRSSTTNEYHALQVRPRNSGWAAFLKFVRLHAHIVGSIAEYIIQNDPPNAWTPSDERPALLRDWSYSMVGMNGSWNAWQKRCNAVRDRLHRKEEEEMRKAGAMLLLCRIRELGYQVLQYHPQPVPEDGNSIEAELRMLGGEASGVKRSIDGGKGR